MIKMTTFEGYRPIGTLDLLNPPRGGSGVSTKRIVIELEMNPYKQLINELQLKLSDCERWLREKDKECTELKNRVHWLENQQLDLTYEEVETLFRVSNAVDDSEDLDFVKNCKSGSQKLYGLMEKMKENKELK
jgi:uncharacterized protein YeeX (DUF496 family)